ncbi:hypothetical protein ATCC90586_010277 [Pythium insidiosum]|nr:hypothetical protein ATCC90586_010277 [Pythium insidiosum]
MQDKPILRGVSGAAYPGELLVLMGPSGAGKSTLLDCIANRNASATGDVRVNGQPWTKALAKHASYVMQDDLFYASLTVREHLHFQAKLRMAKSCTSAEREARVAAIVSELGLTKVLDTPIGGANIKGLSGGQRKRLSFATELLTNPSVLFVDEPTSGLDSFMAETVVLLMRDLARRGRTVIATIHQPASDLFVLFDKLYLLVDGRTVYNGPATESVAFFASQGLVCPAFMNPTDFFMKQLVVMDDQPDARRRVDGLVAAWAAKATAESFAGASASACTEPSPTIVSDRSDGASDAPELALQLRVLCERNVFRLVRDVVGFRARVGSTIFVSLISGLVFLQLSLDQTGIQDFTGVIFFIAVNQFIFSANPEFVSVPLEIPLILREHNGGLYHAVTWYVAKNVSELPFQALFPMLFLVPAYFLIGFPVDASLFFSFYAFIASVASCAVGMGYMVSCLTKRVDLAPMLGVLFILPALLFGGLFLNSDSTPVYFVWLQQISPIKYAFHGLMRAYWTRVDAVPCDASTGRCIARSGADVLANNNIESDGMASDLLLLLAVNVGFRVLGGALLWRRTHDKHATH